MSWRKYAITPVAKPRMTQRDHWMKRPSVARYWQYKAEVQKAFRGEIPAHAHVLFVLPMPESWSARKRLDHHERAHLSKPDVDNLHKGLLDALFEDDAHIWDARVTKIWGYEGSIWVREISIPVLPRLPGIGENVA